ncbi:MarR family winged helix-turn-helix transcriptional regulator [Amycolatopsis sp.]|uniref:MarR family winged helix-turn-helix transcriptional regulator n=1 Tax=Amycolatopsis sp. TaxID=37632 RepID=UPI002C787EE8|nr:MarR family winged helix-turn-helix transcriptional regulator [Amycolatopsis sp.]HVV12947.1 MarR family winged helix-turn-helix transcriptional regulator [Amycolatopsis sp.]
MNSQPSFRVRSVGRDDYVPAYLSLISNALSWGGSRLFLRLHGVGINEWRVLSAIVNAPGSTATRLGEELGLNKSVISRSIQLMQTRDLVAIETSDGRRGLRLTARGHELHDQLMAISLKREELLLAGFSEEEKRLLLSFLRRMHRNVPVMNAYDPEDPVRV